MAQLSEQAIKELTDYLEVQGLAWAKEFIAGRKAWLASKGIKASGELISSLQTEVLSTLEGAAMTRIELFFVEHGRFIEIKNLRAPKGGEQYIAALEQWIEDKGLQGKFTKNYLKKRNIRNEPANILNQLAWSVAISRLQRTKRRKQWYNKPKSAAIADLFNRVAANLPELLAQEIKNAFQQ